MLLHSVRRRSGHLQRQIEHSLNEIVTFGNEEDSDNPAPYRGMRTRHGEGRQEWSSFSRVSFRTQTSSNPVLSHARRAPTPGQILPGSDYYGGARRISRSVSPCLQPYPVVPRTALPNLGGGGRGFGSSSYSSASISFGNFEGDGASGEGELSPESTRRRLHSLQLGKVNVTSVRATSPFLRQRAADYEGVVSDKVDALDTRLKRIHHEVGVPMADLRVLSTDVKFF